MIRTSHLDESLVTGGWADLTGNAAAPLIREITQLACPTFEVGDPDTGAIFKTVMSDIAIVNSRRLQVPLLPHGKAQTSVNLVQAVAISNPELVINRQ